jgi:hypothetical protein
MADKNVKDDEMTMDEEIIVDDAPKKGILTRIGEGLTKAGEKLDAFNQRHKVISTIVTVGTGVAIGAGATVAYVKHAQTGIGVSSEDEFDDYGYDDPNIIDSTATSESDNTAQ